MTDITKCANYKKCPLHKQCWRVSAPDDKYGWQSYADYYVEGKQECDHFIQTKGEKNV